MLLVFVIAAILPLTCMKQYWIGWKSSTNCAGSLGMLGGDKQGALPVIRVIAAVFDKKTRLIVKRMAFKWKGTLSWWYFTAGVEGEEYDWNKVSVGFYAAFIRVTDERRSENPVTNVFLVNETEFDGSPLQAAGTGYDFSKMYNVPPVVPFFHLVDEKKMEYAKFDTYCNQTNGWIANQGYYKFDLETKEWTAIYYDPHHTDFYY